MSMTLCEAKEITGGLSKPSKMPCFSFSLPPSSCIAGRKYRLIPDSICSKCYAHKGNYARWRKNLERIWAKRLNGLYHPKWIEAMAFLINESEKSGYFRWFDAGDVQGVSMLRNICSVCTLTSHIRHWLPTREVGFVRDFVLSGGRVPSNLTIRISQLMIDQPVGHKYLFGYPSSGVSTKGLETCPAHRQGNKCGDCRLCWDATVAHVIYKFH